MRPTPATYPKTYATITGLLPPPDAPRHWPYPGEIIARTEDGREVAMRIEQKDGGSRGRLRIGARIKIFRRPQDSRDRFRFVGR
jgi:hypothetical protein